MSDDKIWLPVRCCCDPKRVFGFLRLSAADVLRGSPCHRTVTFEGHTLELRRFLERPSIAYDVAVPIDAERRGHTEELAVYSDDRPREFWRGFSDFIEAAS